MIAIIEETALPTTTSNPDIEPTYIEGKLLSPRLDRNEYEYDDEPSVDHTWDGEQSVRSGRSGDDADDARSLARTFGVKSQNGNSLRHYASFDSSLRQNIPNSKSSMNGIPLSHSVIPPVPAKSPARHQTELDHQSLSEFGAGPSARARPMSAMALGSGGRYFYDSAEAGPSRYMDIDPSSVSLSHEGSGSETPRSTTPASSFYARPSRKIPMQIGNRSSSLLDRMEVDDTFSTPPRSDRLPRSSDEGYDSRSNSTGSHSYKTPLPPPVDVKLRSMPGVVGLGEGWAGGPQSQNKKRKLWFKRKSKSDTKAEEDPLALWSIQEGGVGNPPGKAGPKKGVFKEAWNRSINALGSMPALASGDRADGGNANGTGGGIKGFFSRSKLDLAEDKGNKRSADRLDQAQLQTQTQDKKAKRRTVAFFGMSKSQVELTTPKHNQAFTIPPAQPAPQSPPSPSPASRTSASQNGNPDLSSSDYKIVPPIDTDITPRATRRLSTPLSAPAVPGGLPPPWRPQSFIIPRPDLSVPAPRPFSRHEERSLTEEPEQLEMLDQSLPSLSASRLGQNEPQTSISSAGIETPRTNSGGISLKHKSSAPKFIPLQDEAEEREPRHQTRPMSSLEGRSTTPYSSPPNNYSTPGLDTLQDWAEEGKRPFSRAFRPAQHAPPPFPEQARSQTPSWMSTSFIDRIKQALTITPADNGNNRIGQTPSKHSGTPTSGSMLGSTPQKHLPDLPSRSGTPIMPGAYPADSPMDVEERSLPPSPYDITQAVAREMLATPSPSRPSSRAEPRRRGLSGDLWARRLGKVPESEVYENAPRPSSRASTRTEKRNSYYALAGRLGFGSLRRTSSGAATALSPTSEHGDTTRGTGMDVSPFIPSAPIITPLAEPDFGQEDLGLDDILDEKRRMTLVRDLEAALPLPPARDEPMSPRTATTQLSPSTIASQPTTRSSGSDATILAAPAEIGEDGRQGHKSHPSTSTTTTLDLDELMTPTQLRKSFERSMDERRGSSGSGTALESDRGFTRHQWPTRKHTRNTSSMGSIGELASDIMNNKLKIPGQDGSKRGSIIVDTEDEDELRIREREVRALSFASSISSAMSIDEEEAVPMSATRVSLFQQVKTRQMSLGEEVRV